MEALSKRYNNTTQARPRVQNPAQTRYLPDGETLGQRLRGGLHDYSGTRWELLPERLHRLFPLAARHHGLPPQRRRGGGGRDPCHGEASFGTRTKSSTSKHYTLRNCSQLGETRWKTYVDGHASVTFTGNGDRLTFPQPWQIKEGSRYLQRLTDPNPSFMSQEPALT